MMTKNKARKIAARRAAAATGQKYTAALRETRDAAPVTDAPEPEAATDTERAKSVEKIASALDIDPAELIGPSPDGLPDHWADAAEQMRADADVAQR